MQAALASLLTDMGCAGMPAAMVQLVADVAAAKGRQLPEADHAMHSSLEPCGWTTCGNVRMLEPWVRRRACIGRVPEDPDDCMHLH